MKIGKRKKNNKPKNGNKVKMEKNAELHQENILAYINVISKKDKIIETLSKHHVLCKINK